MNYFLRQAQSAVRLCAWLYVLSQESFPISGSPAESPGLPVRETVCNGAAAQEAVPAPAPSRALQAPQSLSAFSSGNNSSITVYGTTETGFLVVASRKVLPVSYSPFTFFHFPFCTSCTVTCLACSRSISFRIFSRRSVPAYAALPERRKRRIPLPGISSRNRRYALPIRKPDSI